MNNDEMPNIFKAINRISKATNIPKSKILRDYLLSKVKYKCSISDYELFKFYKLSSSEKSTFLTYGHNKELIKLLNSKNDVSLIENQKLYLKTFNKFLNYKWLELTGNNITDFYELINKSNQIETCENYTNPYTKVEKDLKNYTKTYNDLFLSKKFIVKECIEESNETNIMNNKVMNLLKIVTINNNIILANLETTYRNEKIYAPINLETGIIDYPGCTINKKLYEIHPKSKIPILWFKIPKWPRIKRFAINISNVLENSKYVEWTICLSTKGPSIVKINLAPNYQIYQLPNNHEKTGIKKIIDEELKEK